MLNLSQTSIKLRVTRTRVLRKHIKVGHPAIRAGHFIQKRCQARVALLEPTTRSHAIGLIVEALRPNRVPLFERLALDNFSVQRGHAVDRVRGVAGDPGHADSIARDGGHVVNGCAINAALGHVDAEAAVDLSDDFRNTREETIEDVDIPGLQSLSQNRVVCVRKGTRDNSPRIFPTQAMLIHQDAHELRNRKNRVGVIELDGVVLCKTAQVRTMLSNVVINDGLQRRRAEEVLLANTQNLTFKGRVVRVKNARDIHGALAVDNRISKALRIERVVVELFHGLGLPQTQRIDVLGAITGNRHVIRNRTNGQVRIANNALFLFATNNEGVALFHPRIRVLGLETIVEELLEEPVAVQDAITGDGKVQGCTRIKEARCQTAKTTITQSCIGFFF